MTDVGTIAGIVSATTSRTPVAASTKATDAGGATDFTTTLANVGSSTTTSATTTSATTATSTGSATQSMMPQIKNDPVAGLITEYYSPTGSLISQVPSTLALTYLRAGLTADGTKRSHEVGMDSSVFA